MKHIKKQNKIKYKGEEKKETNMSSGETKQVMGNPRTAAAEPVHRLLDGLEGRRRVDFRPGVYNLLGLRRCSFGH